MNSVSRWLAVCSKLTVCPPCVAVCSTRADSIGLYQAESPMHSLSQPWVSLLAKFAPCRVPSDHTKLACPAHRSKPRHASNSAMACLNTGLLAGGFLQPTQNTVLQIISKLVLPFGLWCYSHCLPSVPACGEAGLGANLADKFLSTRVPAWLSTSGRAGPVLVSIEQAR